MARIFCIILFLFSQLSLADTFPATSSYWMITHPPVFSTSLAACNSTDGTTLPNGLVVSSSSINSANPSLCSRSISDGSINNVTINVITSCPTGTRDNSDGTCTSTCVSPQVYDSASGTCVTPTDCSSAVSSPEIFLNIGQPASFKSSDPTTYVTSTCFQSCNYNVDPHKTSYNQQNPDKTYSILGYSYATGSSCSIGTSTNDTLTQKSCADSGKSFGTINGVNVCLGNGTAGSASTIDQKSKTVTDSSTGNTVVTNTTTTNNNDGTVTNTDITTTTTPSGVKTTATDQTQQDQKSFCEQNPNSTICKTSNFSGSCGAFQCDGDAIQCSIAKEQHQRDCDLIDKHDDISDKGVLVSSGIDPNASNDPTAVGNISHVSVPSSLDETAHFSGQLSDEPVSIGRYGSITLPFSKLNFVLSAAGNILLAFSYFAAARIVGIN